MNIKNLKIFIGVLLSIWISTFLWDKILLNYENPENVIGVYSELNFSRHNDLLRFLVFTLFPILTYVLLSNYYYKKELCKFSTLLLVRHPNNITDKSKILILLIILIILSFVNFILTDLPLQKIDVLHDGLPLGNGYNSKITNSFWINTFTNNSLFSDFLNPRIAWFLSQEESIGALRVNHIFLRFITEIFLIIFIYEYIKILNFKEDIQLFAFLVLCLSAIYLNQKLTENFYPVRYRDIPIFFFLAIMVRVITTNKGEIFFFFFGRCNFFYFGSLEFR
jgi:hypothetical protein